MTSFIRPLCPHLSHLETSPIDPKVFEEVLCFKDKDPSCVDLFALSSHPALLYGSRARVPLFELVHCSSDTDLDAMLFFDFSMQQQEAISECAGLLGIEEAKAAQLLRQVLHGRFHPLNFLEVRLLLRLAATLDPRLRFAEKSIATLLEEMRARFYTEPPFFQLKQPPYFLHFNLCLNGLPIDLTCRETLPEKGFSLNSFQNIGVWYRLGGLCEAFYMPLYADRQGSRSSTDYKKMMQQERRFALQESDFLSAHLHPEGRSYCKNALNAIFAMDCGLFPEDEVEALVQMLKLLDGRVVQRRGEEASLEEWKKEIVPELHFHLKKPSQRTLFGIALLWLSLGYKRAAWQVNCLGARQELLWVLQDSTFINSFLLTDCEGNLFIQETLHWVTHCLKRGYHQVSSLQEFCELATSKVAFLAFWLTQEALVKEDLPEVWQEEDLLLQAFERAKPKTHKAFFIALQGALKADSHPKWLDALEASYTPTVPCIWTDSAYEWVARQTCPLSVSKQATWQIVRRLWNNQPGTSRAVVSALFALPSAKGKEVAKHQEGVFWNKESNLWNFWVLRLQGATEEEEAAKALDSLRQLPPCHPTPMQTVLQWLPRPTLTPIAAACFQRWHQESTSLELTWEQLELLSPFLTAEDHHSLFIQKKQGTLPSTLNVDEVLIELRKVGSRLEKSSPEEVTTCQQRLFLKWFKGKKEQRALLKVCLKECHCEEVSIFLPFLASTFTSPGEQLECFAFLVQKDPTRQWEEPFISSPYKVVAALAHKKTAGQVNQHLATVFPHLPAEDSPQYRTLKAFLQTQNESSLLPQENWDLMDPFYLRWAVQYFVMLFQHSIPFSDHKQRLFDKLVVRLESKPILTLEEAELIVRKGSLQGKLSQGTVERVVAATKEVEEFPPFLLGFFNSCLRGEQFELQAFRLFVAVYERLSRVDLLLAVCIAHHFAVQAELYGQEEIYEKASSVFLQLASPVLRKKPAIREAYLAFLKERFSRSPLHEWQTVMRCADLFKREEQLFLIEAGVRSAFYLPARESTRTVKAYEQWKALVEKQQIPPEGEEEARAVCWISKQLLELRPLLERAPSTHSLPDSLSLGAFHLFLVMGQTKIRNKEIREALKMTLECTLPLLKLNDLLPHLEVFHGQLVAHVAGEPGVITQTIVKNLSAVIVLIQLQCNKALKEIERKPIAQKSTLAQVSIPLNVAFKIHRFLNDLNFFRPVINDQFISLFTTAIAEWIEFLCCQIFFKNALAKYKSELQGLSSLWNSLCDLYGSKGISEEDRERVEKLAAIYLRLMQGYERFHPPTVVSEINQATITFTSVFGAERTAVILQEAFPLKAEQEKTLSSWASSQQILCEGAMKVIEHSPTQKTVDQVVVGLTEDWQALDEGEDVTVVLGLLTTFTALLPKILCRYDRLPSRLLFDSLLVQLISKIMKKMPSALAIASVQDRSLLLSSCQTVIGSLIHALPLHGVLNAWIEQSKETFLAQFEGASPHQPPSFWLFFAFQSVLLALYEEYFAARKMMIPLLFSFVDPGDDPKRILEHACTQLTHLFPKEALMGAFLPLFSLIEQEGVLVARFEKEEITFEVSKIFIPKERLEGLKKLILGLSRE